MRIHIFFLCAILTFLHTYFIPFNIQHILYIEKKNYSQKVINNIGPASDRDDFLLYSRGNMSNLILYK